MQAQSVFSNYIDSYMDEESVYGNTYLNNQLKKEPTTYNQPEHNMAYQHQFQGHGVRIAQQEDESSYGNNGMWGLEHMTIEGAQKSYSEVYPYSRPLLPLDTEFDNSSFPCQSQFHTDSTLSTAHSDMTAYSNESSPFMNSYMLPSAPRTPVTPATTPLLNGQYYTVPGVPGAFVLVPIMARDPEGNYTTVFYPKSTMLNSCVEEDYSLSYSGSQAGYGHDAYNASLQFPQQDQQSFNFTQEKETYMDACLDDGPELVGMGLYDEPPELLFSNVNTPELAQLSNPSSNGDGRGLVLEQSFGLPEEEEEEEGEEYEYEEDEEETGQQAMRY